MTYRRYIAAILLAIFCSSNTQADTFSIQINYLGADPQYEAAFTEAATIWGGLISEYQNGVVTSASGGSSYGIGDTMNTLYLDADIMAIDGTGGILGFAGPTEIAVDQLGFTLSTDGVMTFDLADVPGLVSNGTFTDVILHEMAHTMGFGTLWTDNDVYVNGSGEFTGAEATSFWASEFGQSGTPDVELGGGSGTANGHWNENNGGSGSTGITDSMGRDMRDELMTGWLNSNSFISEMTVASFVDIGYVKSTAVPEPGSMLVLGLFGTLFFRRKRN